MRTSEQYAEYAQNALNVLDGDAAVEAQVYASLAIAAAIREAAEKGLSLDAESRLRLANIARNTGAR